MVMEFKEGFRLSLNIAEKPDVDNVSKTLYVMECMVETKKAVAEVLRVIADDLDPKKPVTRGS